MLQTRTVGLACVFCGKRFECRSHMERHGRVHTEEKPFPCPFCGKRFALKSTATRHERVHVCTPGLFHEGAPA